MAAFFRLFDCEDKGDALAHWVDALHDGGSMRNVYVMDTALLRLVPGSPFAYWVSDRVRRLFREMAHLEGEDRTVRIGASTKDDFRWLRLWWECQTTDKPQRWIPMAKGGERSAYYAPVHLSVDWKDNGDYLGNWVYQYRPREGHRWGSTGLNARFYYRPGITWPRRTSSLSVRALPAGCVFSDKAPCVFIEKDDPAELLALCALMNSRAFRGLVAVQVARVSLAQGFEAGLVQTTPVPNLSAADADALATIGRQCFHLKRECDSANETSHAFSLPGVLQAKSNLLSASLTAWVEKVLRTDGELERKQAEIDRRSYRLYGVSDADLQSEESSANYELEEDEEKASDTDDLTERLEQQSLVIDLLSYALGSVMGRWDIRVALDTSFAPKIQEPFDPLPVCSPGMLVGPDGLPAKRGSIVSEAWLCARPDVTSLPPDGFIDEPTIPDEAYPLRIDWDGILVDDERHEDDIVRRVRDVLALLWGDRAEAIEQEACAILGVQSLRDCFRNPSGFWDFHAKRYSKSRRKAPIYWLLQSSKRAYGLWLYYPRLDPDTLFKALGYVGNRLLLEQGRLDEALGRRRTLGETGDAKTRRELDKRIEAHEAFITEVSIFRAELQRVADLGLTVDHDDGVLLSIAPLHNLIPWSPARAAWNELMAGKYGWSSIGQQLRAKGPVREAVRG